MNRNDLWVTAQTIYGEARGEPVAGQYAVAHVILNRARKHAQRPKDVCLQPFQFGCWTPTDPNYEKILDLDLSNQVFVRCVQVALEVLAGLSTDPTHEATHYHTTSILPSWAKGHTPCYRVGHHVFYNEVA
jgi:spore germination cell wall hydrolase CwlJ-like protein